MIVPQNRSRYTTDRTLIVGGGFVDTFSNIYNSIKPTLNNFGSFIKQNKDLLIKPVRGAVGSLAATGISKGVPTVLSHIMNRRQQRLQEQVPPPKLDEKSNEILNAIISRERSPIKNIDMESYKDVELRIPTTNIIGDGLNKKKRSYTRKTCGSGLKIF